MPGVFSSKRCFLFDLDGTLVDSNRAHALAFTTALTSAYPEMARDFDYSLFAGRPTREVFQALGIQDDSELMSLTIRKQKNYRDALAGNDVSLFPGTRKLLERLHRDGRRLFLVTGASRASTDRVLQDAGLLPFFENLTTAEDTACGKPSPEPYLHCLSANGLAVSECLAIEDGIHGITSAQKAGVDVIAIHTALELPGVPNVGDCATFSSILFT